MSNAMAQLLTASIRITAVLGAACLVTILLRRSTASVRHMVWASAIGAMVLTPVLLQIPAGPVTLPDTFARWSQSVGVTRTVDDAVPVEPTSMAANATSKTTTPAANDRVSGGSMIVISPVL